MNQFFNYLLAYKDLYCERTSFGLWGEPANFISNIAFLIPAYIAYRRKSKFFTVLPLLIAAASLFYHSFANELTYLIDVSCIISTIVFYYMFFFNSIGIKKVWAVGGVLSYLVFLMMSLQALPLEYSYYGVLPLMAAQLAMLFSKSRHMDCLKVLMGLGAFSFALVARFYDAAICESFPHGTHFLWHIFSALTLAALIPCLKYQVSEST